jgi:hypothetical protein
VLHEVSLLLFLLDIPASQVVSVYHDQSLVAMDVQLV